VAERQLVNAEGPALYGLALHAVRRAHQQWVALMALIYNGIDLNSLRDDPPSPE
jgi:hypothetical protein